MPRGDRTGPNGAGPMTGRGMGHCSGAGQPGFTSGEGGRGMGMGRGMMGRGGGNRQRFRSWFQGNPVPQVDPVEEQYIAENEMLHKKVDDLTEKLAKLAEKIDKLTDKK